MKPDLIQGYRNEASQLRIENANLRAALTAAAEAGENEIRRIKAERDDYKDALAALKIFSDAKIAATIERCAHTAEIQLVDEAARKQIVAAIRALKDK